MERRIEEDIPILGKVYVNFVNLASIVFELYEKENEIARQKNIPHLGLIARAFKGVNHSRYEYLIIQCVISELADNNFKGTTSAQGNIKINGQSYFGNDVIKMWFLLSNFGHCKNTVGDEKALLLKANQKKGFRSQLINSLKDDELKIWANNTIDNFDYIKFHHILSIRRIYKSIPRKLDIQKKIISVYKLLLLDSSLTTTIANQLQVEQLKIIYNNIRDLSILALDSRNSSLPISIDILSTVLSFDFYENRYQQTRASQIFNPMMSLLYDTLYLNIKSQTRQRAYEINAFSSLEDNINTCIERAFNNGLANPNECNLTHFLRIELHINNVDEIHLGKALRNCLTVKRGINNYVEASLDFNPFTSIRVIDFYIVDNHFDVSHLPKFLTNINGILENQIRGTLINLIHNKLHIFDGLNKGIKNISLSEDNETILRDSIFESISSEYFQQIIENNIPAFRNILWAVLRFHIKDNYYFDIDHHTSKDYKFFGVNRNNEEDLLTIEVDRAISTTTDNDRKHELKQLLQSIKRKFKGTTIACLSRITVYDYSKSPDKRKVTDIDSLVLKFNEDTMLLELHESKNTRTPYRDAKKDLNQKLISILNKNCTGYRIREVKGYGAKLIIKHNS
ncbi:hypothetical protein ACFSC6_01395 [Rufibacter sediminis]|uniref:Uncharacterized protein n=1 Tax=Rufibacter sediminis TaxID=2762756 RepID=A0ABR6VTV2_9BACT|nr:hypothetical protein [Rufibacter sediminis]MBC3540248.1 hypothetical protein [Rufibacter sediminis]